MNTNFANLTSEQKTFWSRDFWSQARNFSFVSKFLGKDDSAMIQHIDELKATEKGTRAVITLVADSEGDGVVGDRTLKGNEEVLKSYDQVIRYDQWRNAHHNEGRMAEQKTIVNFREQAKNKLAYQAADRLDQLGFLTLSGVPYSQTNKGAPRIGSDLINLEFAADVKPPSAKRNLTWQRSSMSLLVNQGTAGIVNGAIGTGDYPCWEMLVQAKAYAKDNYVRGVISKEGEELYHVFLTPQAMAKMKLDATYRDNLRYSTMGKGESGAQFTGSSVKVDGLMLHEFRHVYNTANAVSGSKWGSSGTVDGCQILFCGAQAMAMADIGDADWDEEKDDYNNSFGIAVAKRFGFLKPQFYTQYSGGTVQDHGVISIYCAQ